MTKISEVISKPVISLYNCEFVGIVKNILFDKIKKMVKYIIILNEEDDIEYAIKTNGIYKINNDAILIKNNEELELKSNLELESYNFYSLINLPAFNIDGEFLGKIKEVEIDEKYKINNMETNKNQILNKDIKKIEKVVICSNEKINFRKFKKRIKFEKPKENYTVTLQVSKPKLPSKALINENMLLNRVVYNNILDQNNQTIIKANTIINNTIIEIAKKYGKLKDLIKNSF